MSAKTTSIVCVVILLLSICPIAKAQTTSLCFTNSRSNAHLAIRFTDSLPTADICVWTGSTTMADVDICFTKYSSSTSINISLVENSSLADYRIFLTTNPFEADKTISITPRMTAADICVGIWNSPASFTKDIYIKGIDSAKLPMEQKVAILYCLGLLKKRR